MWPNPQETVYLVTYLLKKSLMENFIFFAVRVPVNDYKCVIQNPVKQLRWSVLRNMERFVNYFRKTLHLRFLRGFWISLWIDLSYPFGRGAYIISS